MTHNDLNRGMVYDKEVCSIPRPQMFQMWIDTSLKKFIAIKDDRAVGFMFAQKGVKGFRVSPFYARDYSIAQSLMHMLVSTMKDSEMIGISLPEENENSLLLCVNVGLDTLYQKCFIERSVTMYTQGEIAVQLDQCYGFTDYEPVLL